MGRIGKDISYFNNAGGINQATSPFQMGDDECQDALNVYFIKYGKYGVIRKRKGLLVINGTALDGRVLYYAQYELRRVDYFAVFTSNGTLYSFNMSTGVGTSVKTGLSTAKRPTFTVVNNECFANFNDELVTINDCNVTTNVTKVGSDTTKLTGPTVSTAVRYAYGSSLQILSDDTVANNAGFEHTPAAALDLTSKNLEFQLAVAPMIKTVSRARANNVATITVAAGHGLATGNTVVIQTVGGTGYNSTPTSVVITIPAGSTTTFTYPNVGADETTAADTAGRILPQNLSVTKITKYRITLYTNAAYTYWEGTKNAYGDSLWSLPTWNKIKLPVDLATKTGDSGGGCTINNITKYKVEVYTSAAYAYALYIDKIESYRVDGGIYSTIDNTTWTLTTNPFAPRPLFMTTFEGRLFTVDKDTLAWSNIGDGKDFFPYSAVYDRDGDGVVDTGKSASNTPISQGDGDSISGLAVLGRQLIVFKYFGLYRISSTGSTPAYRVDPQLSGIAGQGIGCISHFSIRNAVLENMYSDIYGKAEYLLFASAKGIHALGITGNPLDIQARVQKTFDGIALDALEQSFAVVNPRTQQYILCYPSDSTGVSYKQLVFGLRSKAWSIYGMSAITCASEYVDTASMFTIFGDSNGYLYKHDWRAVDLSSDYNDNNTAIPAYWVSKNITLTLEDRYKQILTTTVRTYAPQETTYLTLTGLLDNGLQDVQSVELRSTTQIKNTTPVFDGWVTNNTPSQVVASATDTTGNTYMADQLGNLYVFDGGLSRLIRTTTGVIYSLVTIGSTLYFLVDTPFSLYSYTPDEGFVAIDVSTITPAPAKQRLFVDATLSKLYIVQQLGLYAAQAHVNFYRYNGGTSWTLKLDAYSAGGGTEILDPNMADPAKMFGAAVNNGVCYWAFAGYTGAAQRTFVYQDSVNIGSLTVLMDTTTHINDFWWNTLVYSGGNLYLALEAGKLYKYTGSWALTRTVGTHITQVNMSGSTVYVSYINTGYYVDYLTGTTWTTLPITTQYFTYPEWITLGACIRKVGTRYVANPTRTDIGITQLVNNNWEIPGLTSGYLDVGFPTRWYTRACAYKFSNSTINQGMDIYGWTTEVIPTDNKKGV